jgi:hypothetical protein
MLRHSLIAAAFALATITSSAVPGSAATANVSGHPHYRTVVHHVYTYEPAPSPYYYGRIMDQVMLRHMLRRRRSPLYLARQFALPFL